MICSEIIPFDELDKDLWIQCETKDVYIEKEQKLFDLLAKYDGRDTVHIFLKTERAHKQLPMSRSTKACPELLEQLADEFGAENVKVVENSPFSV